MMAAEGESMMAAAAAAGKDTLGSLASGKRRCKFLHCLCCWAYRNLLPRRAAPGSDYVCIADADHRPAWSLLVGVTDGTSSLRVSRLRVARSGRILGRSDDALEPFHNIVLAKPPGYCFQAGAALDPNGRSLCVLRQDAIERTQALQLSLQQDTDTVELPLPEIEGTSPCIPISAAGQIWALSATLLKDDVESFSVVTRRLVGGGRWEHVGLPFTSRLMHNRFPPWRGDLLQGYAVLPDDNLILVSFQQHGLFLTFDTDTGSWTRVLIDTDETRLQCYLPIFGRGLYVEQHQAVYMLRHNIIYAYKLAYQEDDQGMRQLKLDPPVEIDFLCPFIPEKGYGFLTHLAGHLMCSVWISLAWCEPCPCDNLHAIVTTFHLRDPAEGGIQVLHSTYRRIDMVPNPPDQNFCFLHEYKDRGSPVLQQHEEEQEDLTSSQHVGGPSEMLRCCRSMLESRSLTPRCFKCGCDGHVAHQCSVQPEDSSTMPLLGPSRSIPVDPSSRQRQVRSSSPVVPMKPATTTIKKDVFIICQAGSLAVIYQTGAMDDDCKPLQPCYVADADHYWHFFQDGSKIHAVSSIGDGMFEFSLNKDRTPIMKRPIRRPSVGPFVMVIRVGRETIALTDTLQVFHQTQFTYRSTTWLRYRTDQADFVSRRVRISGYAALNDNSFIVYDAITCSLLLFDLGANQWRLVLPLSAFEEDNPTTIRTKGLLNGRCVFVDGFIYTCIYGGLAAYELLGEDHTVYLREPIFLPFTWHNDCLGEDMCLDYAGKCVDSGANFFYVVKGEYFPPKTGVRIRTIKVKTKRTASNKIKPVGIDHVGSVTRFIDHTGAINTRCCFAVSCL